jgi:hypothetical protein
MIFRPAALAAVLAPILVASCGGDGGDAAGEVPPSPDGGASNDAGPRDDTGLPAPDVEVAPPAPTYTVGGTVAGLARQGLVLENGAKDPLAVSADGTFVFPTALADGAEYAVTIASQPEAQTCVVTNGAGKITGAAVTSVAVTCTHDTVQLGGERQGLSLSLTGALTTLAGTPVTKDATGASAGFHSPDLMTVVGGSLFVADATNQAIRKLDLATNVVTTLAGGPAPNTSVDGTGPAAGILRPGGIASDGTNLYVTEDSFCKVRKVVIATGVVTTIAGSSCGTRLDGNGTAARFFLPHGVVLDGTTLYIAEALAVRKMDLTTGDVTTLAGGTSGTADGVGAAAQFQQLWDIVRVGGDLYASDRGSHTIRKIAIASGTVTTVAGAAGVRLNVDGTGTAARFALPHGLATNGTDLYVACAGADTIRRMVLATSEVTTIAGSNVGPGAVDAVGTAARFHRPLGLALDGSSLYVSDNGNRTIRNIALATSAVTTIASTSAGTDGVGPAARFGEPGQVATDGTNVFVADPSAHTIRKIVIATGAVTTLAGTSGRTGITDGIGAAARFRNPAGVTTDGVNVYVADSGSHRIRKIVVATREVTTLAGGDTAGAADGTGSAARFDNPGAITMDASHLYVADTWNHAIRKIEIASGVVTTIAGGSAGSADGTGLAAQFRFPGGIAVDGTNLYVADTLNHAVRKVVIATGVVTTIAGSVDASNGSTDASGLSARFDSPTGISTDGTNLYVGDYGNHTIRKVVIASGVVTTIAGAAGTKGTGDGQGASARLFYPWGVANDGVRLFVGDSNGATLRVLE